MDRRLYSRHARHVGDFNSLGITCLSVYLFALLKARSIMSIMAYSCTTYLHVIRQNCISVTCHVAWFVCQHHNLICLHRLKLVLQTQTGIAETEAGVTETGAGATETGAGVEDIKSAPAFVARSHVAAATCDVPTSATTDSDSIAANSDSAWRNVSSPTSSGYGSEVRTVRTFCFYRDSAFALVVQQIHT